MVDVNVKEYNTKFLQYLNFVPYIIESKPVLIGRYIWGLVNEIRDLVKMSKPQTLDSAMEMAGILTNKLIRTREKEEIRKLT